MKKINIYLYIFLFISLTNSQCIKSDVYLKNFDLDDVLKNGRDLMSLDYGLHYLEPQSNEQKKLFIGVHGSNSEGYEWIYPYLTVDSSETLVTFFRYSDNFCPNKIHLKLNKEINSVLDKNKNINEVILMGHSYGGMIVSIFSYKWIREIPLTIHTVAAPLSGPVLSDPRSGLLKNICEYNPPTMIRENIDFYQWRTIKELDGIFKDLEYDPQTVKLKGSTVVRLPNTYNGKRLGHNWSLSWVAEQIVE